MRYFSAVALFVVVSSAMSASAADRERGAENAPPIGLTGEDRTSFVNSAFDSCLDTASQDPDVEASSVREYCACAANYMADRIDPADAKEAAADPDRASEIIAPYAKDAAGACTYRLQRRADRPA